MNKIGPGIAKIQQETFAEAHLCLYGTSIYGAVILVKRRRKESFFNAKYI
jgi:hypothetical protein